MLRRKWLGLLALASLSICMVVAATHYFKYQSVHQENVSQVIETSQFQLRFTAKNFSRLRAQVSSTIGLTNKNGLLDQYVSQFEANKKNQVESIWLALANYQTFFKEIRYIDISGLEKIKVSYSVQKQQAVVGSDYNQLNDEFYFKYAQSISNDGIGNVGPILRNDGNESDSDFVPVQYVLSPFYAEGERKGYIVITIDFRLVTSILDYSPQPEYIPQLVTSSGDYIAHPDSDKLFGFSIPSRKTHNLALTHNELWQDMLVNGSGVARTKNGLYVYRLIDLSAYKDMYALVFFSNAQLDEHVFEDYKQILENATLLILLVLVASIPFAFMVYNIQRKTVDSGLALAALNGMTAVIICDSGYRVLKVNKELEKITGYSNKKIKLSKIKSLFFKKDERFRWLDVWETVNNKGVWEGELTIRKKDHSEIITLTRVQALFDSSKSVTNYIVSMIDISERKELEEKLRYLSERDELSQLWNRRKFEQELLSEVELFERYPNSHIGCLALLDIDYFKRINDEQGHDRGDEVIRQVAILLTKNTRKTDTVSRIGGEEFAIIMRHTSIKDALLILERIRSAMEMDPAHPATISIGVTDITGNSSLCYKYADIALYESKSLGRNRVSLCRSSDEIA